MTEEFPFHLQQQDFNVLYFVWVMPHFEEMEMEEYLIE